MKTSRKLPEIGQYVYGENERGMHYVVRLYESETGLKWMDRCGDFELGFIKYWWNLNKHK